MTTEHKPWRVHVLWDHHNAHGTWTHTTTAADDVRAHVNLDDGRRIHGAVVTFRRNPTDHTRLADAILTLERITITPTPTPEP